MTTPPVAPTWMSLVLFCAGVFNLAWGTWTYLYPDDSFSESWVGVSWGEMREEWLARRLWPSVGMLAAAFGVGYLIAAHDPVRHWPVVFVGFLANSFAVVGLVPLVREDEIASRALIWTYPCALIWVVPFVMVLCHAYRTNRAAPASVE